MAGIYADTGPLVEEQGNQRKFRWDRLFGRGAEPTAPPAAAPPAAAPPAAAPPAAAPPAAAPPAAAPPAAAPIKVVGVDIANRAAGMEANGFTKDAQGNWSNAGTPAMTEEQRMAGVLKEQSFRSAIDRADNERIMAMKQSNAIAEAQDRAAGIMRDPDLTPEQRATMLNASSANAQALLGGVNKATETYDISRKTTADLEGERLKAAAGLEGHRVSAAGTLGAAELNAGAHVKAAELTADGGYKSAMAKLTNERQLDPRAVGPLVSKAVSDAMVKYDENPMNVPNKKTDPTGAIAAKKRAEHVRRTEEEQYKIFERISGAGKTS